MDVRPLRADQVSLWRGLRIRALIERPAAFRGTLADEKQRPEEAWAAMVHAITADPDQLALVGELHGAALGMALCRIDPERRELARVGAMWVAPEARRRRLGGRLLEYALSFARSRGASEVELWVTEGNETAREVYESFGFADTGRREPLRLDSCLSALAMRRSIRD